MKRLTAKLLSIVCIVALMCSLFTVAAPSVSALPEAASKKGEGKIYAWGCDMSQWNVNGATYTDYSLVDFNKMKADGCEFVILRIGDEKAGYADRKADPTFVTLYNMARAAGMHVGAYYYSYKTTASGVIGDANFCINIIEKNNMYFEYPIYFDIEADVHYKLSASKQVELCNAWCETMEANGYYPGVYSNLDCAMNNLQASSNFKYDTWVPKPLNSKNSGTQYKPAETTVVDLDKVGNVDFSVNYGMWQYKWYSDSWSEPSYDGSYWYNSEKGWPLDCNVSFRDYPTIMQTYGYNNVVVKHTINFESNGGSAVESAKVTDGGKLTKPANPTKYGFEFGGWYCNPELTDPYDFNTPVPYGFTLYAKWNEANWATNNNLMPNSSQLKLNDFNGQGEIWPYWNTDDYNSVTMYNGVTNDDNWSWPSAYMVYENSFDSVNTPYIYVKKDGDAQFNVMLTYLDKNGEQHDVYLTDVDNSADSDLPAGDLEEFYDVGSYIRNLGHAPASGNVKFVKVTYFVTGVKDSYVKLYDIKFTSKFAIADSFKTMMNSNINQLSGEGDYTYSNGTLTMNAKGSQGYSIKMNINDSINPSSMSKLLMDVNATAPFNVSVELTNGNGDATMNFMSEYFNVFGLETAAAALPAGAWNVNMNLIGYYEWNGGVVSDSTIKSVTITLTQPGTLTLKALQAARTDSINYVQDGASSNGSLGGQPMGDLTGDGEVSTMDARLLMLASVSTDVLTEAQLAIADYNGDGKVNTADARAMLLSLT